jgi:hypothetical protein
MVIKLRRLRWMEYGEMRNAYVRFEVFIMVRMMMW